MQTISNNHAVQARYETLCQEGCDPRLAEMLALRRFPGTVTDREFLKGHCNGNQFDETPLTRQIGDVYRRQAEAAGVNVTGKVYIGQLARFSGDPNAWVENRGDVKRVCEENGMSCEGLVKVETDPGPTYDIGSHDEPLAPDLVLDEMTRTPGINNMSERERHDVAEKIVQRAKAPKA